MCLVQLRISKILFCCFAVVCREEKSVQDSKKEEKNKRNVIKVKKRFLNGQRYLEIINYQMKHLTAV